MDNTGFSISEVGYAANNMSPSVLFVLFTYDAAIAPPSECPDMK